MRRGYRGSWAQVRASFWFYPAAGVVLAELLVLVLLRVRPEPGSAFALRAWPADASTATAVLQTVATACMTAATLSFSLTIVALQLASQQFSPRLLRDFARDRVIQLTIGVLVSGFVVPLTVLRGIESGQPLPVLALLLALLLGLGSGLLLIAFVAHMVRLLRVDTMMAGVHQQARRVAMESYPPYEEGPATDHPELPGPEGGLLVPAPRSGFVRTIDPARLVAAAREHGVFVRLGVRPGDQVVVGTPLAAVFGRSELSDALRRALMDGIALGHERTEEQDEAFGFRQLADIGIKAISPGINDPTTAAEALAYCADLLVVLQGRRLGPQLKRDDAGAPRVVLPDRDHAYYLDLACAQLRRFGRGQPEVLTALLRLLRDCAVGTRDAAQRAAVAAQVDLVEQQLAALDPGVLLPADADAVRDMVRRARSALQGDVDGAYRDRAGETRSV